jgi:hypothetical protein
MKVERTSHVVIPCKSLPTGWSVFQSLSTPSPMPGEETDNIAELGSRQPADLTPEP